MTLSTAEFVQAWSWGFVHCFLPCTYPLEAVHFAAVYVSCGSRLAMRTSAVLIVDILIRSYAHAGFRIRRAHRWLPVLHGDTVSTRVRSEVRVERSILLHDYDDVLDLVLAKVDLTCVAVSRYRETRCCSAKQKRSPPNCSHRTPIKNRSRAVRIRQPRSKL